MRVAFFISILCSAIIANGQIRELRLNESEAVTICEEFYSNGNIKASGKCNARGKFGEWLYYDNNDPQKISEQGFYKDDLKTGEWIEYRWGVRRTSTHYSEGKKHGRFALYYTNGQVQQTCSYGFDKHEGELLGYYEDGVLFQRGYHRDGKNIDTGYFYHRNGSVLSMRLFDEEGDAISKMEYYDNGKPAKKEYYHHKKNIGRNEYYYETGQLKSWVMYDSTGKETGNKEVYYPGGKLNLKVETKDGLSIYREYHENGQLKTEGQSASFHKSGLWKEYDKEGLIIVSGNYVKGKKQGEWIRYHANGKIAQIGMFENDKQSGLWKYYDPKGKLESKGSYKDGLKVGDWKDHEK